MNNYIVQVNDDDGESQINGVDIDQMTLFILMFADIFFSCINICRVPTKLFEHEIVTLVEVRYVTENNTKYYVARGSERHCTTRVGISGTTAKSRKRKCVPSSHTGPGSGIVTEKPNKGRYSHLF